MMMVLHINKTYGIVDETGEPVKYLGSAVDAHIWGVGHTRISKIYLATVDNVIIRQISIRENELVFESTNQ